MDAETFKRNPRNYAMLLVEDGMLSGVALAQALLGSMSYDDIRECLDANELSPRFLNDEDEDCDDDCVDEEGEDNHCGEDCEESSHD